MKSTADLSSIVLLISGVLVQLASIPLAPAVDAVFPGYGNKVVNVVALAAIVAGALVRVLSNPTPTQTHCVPTTSGDTVQIKTVEPATAQNGKP